MKPLFAALMTLTTIFALGDEVPKSTEPVHNQRLYIGPEVFWLGFRDQSRSPGFKIKDERNAVLGGLRGGYDYLNPQTIYIGIEGLFSMGRMWGETTGRRAGYFYTPSSNEIFFVRDRFHNERSAITIFSNIETRLGYPFQGRVDLSFTITPFIGSGWYYLKTTGPSTQWFYGAAGLRFNHSFGRRFDIGTKLKAMYAFYTKGPITVLSSGEEFWGFEVGIPFIWKMGLTGRWNVQLEPYYLKLGVNSLSNIFGLRLNFGYLF